MNGLLKMRDIKAQCSNCSQCMSSVVSHITPNFSNHFPTSIASSMHIPTNLSVDSHVCALFFPVSHTPPPQFSPPPPFSQFSPFLHRFPLSFSMERVPARATARRARGGAGHLPAGHLRLEDRGAAGGKRETCGARGKAANKVLGILDLSFFWGGFCSTCECKQRGFWFWFVWSCSFYSFFVFFSVFGFSEFFGG